MSEKHVGSVRINTKFVKYLMIDKEITARDLANQAGIGEATMYRLLDGEGFTSQTLGKLARALDCHPVDLIQAEGYESPHVVAPAV